jgi:hypothetical protein
MSGENRRTKKHGIINQIKTLVFQKKEMKRYGHKNKCTTQPQMLICSVKEHRCIYDMTYQIIDQATSAAVLSSHRHAHWCNRRYQSEKIINGKRYRLEKNST